MADLRLGLIGDHIAESRAPLLHRLAGRLSGLDVAYDLLVPRAHDMDFRTMFARCRESGYRGINVTHPYKESVVPLVAVDDATGRALGAVNTVTFEADGPRGFNTDYSGFIAAWRSRLPDQRPGSVCVVGAGGAGRAVAFGLLQLGATRLCIVDRDARKAKLLADALRGRESGTEIETRVGVARGVRGADGIVNCTPIGMVGHAGTPVPASLMGAAAWVFDAVYTPVQTRFLQDAVAAGLRTMSGYELFVWQGIHAFEIFCGRKVDEAALRAALDRPARADGPV